VSSQLEAPPGYERRVIDRTTLIARRDVAEPLAAGVAARRELIGFAKDVPGAQPLQGRQTAYAIPIGSEGVRGVVRRNHHGGAFRKLTGSLFLWPTRAPMELAISLRLRRLDIPTPQVLAIAIYRGDVMARADVVTEEIPDSQDLGAVLLATQPESEDRRRAWNAVTRLMKRLASAGVRHHDFNVKNVLLRRMEDDLFGAYVLDVDRVAMDYTRRDAYAGNRARLRRSVEKWRDTKGARISDAEIEALRHRVPSIP
jgi:tRNA A-37 threonylcarbamoyl transferase component Bud32